MSTVNNVATTRSTALHRQRPRSFPLCPLVLFVVSLHRTPSNSLAMSPSPSLPWEVIEVVIDHSADSIATLHSFTLTCRDLCPRSTILLLCRVKLKNRNQLFDLCAVLQTKPYLQPCVRSVSIPAREFSPHPLLRMLPNLFEIEFTRMPVSSDAPAFSNISRKQRSWECITFHPSILTHCRQFG